MDALWQLLIHLRLRRPRLVSLTERRAYQSKEARNNTKLATNDSWNDSVGNANKEQCSKKSVSSLLDELRHISCVQKYFTSPLAKKCPPNLAIRAIGPLRAVPTKAIGHKSILTKIDPLLVENFPATSAS